jgi:hypothetical protein
MPQLSQSDQLMKSLLGKLYQILTAGDGPAQPSPDNFIAWCVPGIPFRSEDLMFASKYTGANGDEERTLTMQAANFSRFVNFIPDTSGILTADQQQTTYNQSGKRLWDIYKNVLQYSQVSNIGELTPEQKDRLDKWNKLLVETYEEENLVTGNMEKKSRPGPLKRGYLDKQKDYVNACLLYNSKRLAALNSETAADVQDWRLNASLYRMQVQNAMDAWVAEGYKNEYETINATIDQWTKRSLVLWKRSLLQNFEQSKETALDGQDFYMTTFWPPRFATTPEGWTKFEFKEQNVSKYSNYDVNAWDTELQVTYGLFSGGVSSSGEISQTNDKLDVSNFYMSFEVIQVPIIRPWFSPDFLTNTAWKFTSGAGMAPLSEGGKPPRGQMPAYPTTAVFIRNLKTDFAELHENKSTYRRDISVGVNVGYGPFRFGGKYRNAHGEDKFTSDLGEQGLTVNGLQLIAFKCAVLPQSPKPSSDITSWT